MYILSMYMYMYMTALLWDEKQCLYRGIHVIDKGEWKSYIVHVEIFNGSNTVG